MAGLWEPVGGVFWSTPPAAVDGVWSYLPIIPVLAVAVIAGLKVWQRIKAKRQQPDWKLRQHMVEIGTAITAVYLFAMLVLVCTRLGQVVTMPLNEVGDFLAGAFGPVAFLWLVLGFLQQGDELRQGTEALLLQAEELKNSVKQQSIMAGEALQQREDRREAAEAERQRREQEIRVLFSIRTGSSGLTGKLGGIMNEINITNDGYQAYNAVLDLQLPYDDCEPIHIGAVKAQSAVSKVVFLPKTSRPVTGTAVLRYEDVDGNQKADNFGYMVTNSNRIEFDRP